VVFLSKYENLGNAEVYLQVNSRNTQRIKKPLPEIYRKGDRYVRKMFSQNPGKNYRAGITCSISPPHRSWVKTVIDR